MGADSLKDETGKFNLKITQRLRLDQPKLEDVTKRMNSSRSHGIFLGLPTTQAIQHQSGHPIAAFAKSHFVLETKGSCGSHFIDSFRLFTRCPLLFPTLFLSQDLLRREAIDLADETVKDEYLVVVVV